MKKFSFLLTGLILSISLTSIAQERNVNPGEDPNEAMVPDGAGVPNYGCSDPTKSCFKNMKHTRLQDATRAQKGSSAPDRSGSAPAGQDQGTR